MRLTCLPFGAHRQSSRPRSLLREAQIRDADMVVVPSPSPAVGDVVVADDDGVVIVSRGEVRQAPVGAAPRRVSGKTLPASPGVFPDRRVVQGDREDRLWRCAITTLRSGIAHAILRSSASSG